VSSRSPLAAQGPAGVTDTLTVPAWPVFLSTTLAAFGREVTRAGPLTVTA